MLMPTMSQNSASRNKTSKPWTIHPVQAWPWPPMTVGFFFSLLNWRRGSQDRSLPESRTFQKPSFLSSTLCTRFGVSKCTSGVAEVTRTLCKPMGECTFGGFRSLVKVCSLVSVGINQFYGFMFFFTSLLTGLSNWPLYSTDSKMRFKECRH